jgi:hypothetical protein
MTAVMKDRRQERRRRSLLGGKLSFNHRRTLFDCVIRNFSSSGALLVFADATMLPMDFDIQVPHWKEAFHARMVWRKREHVGVILDEFMPAAVSLDDVRRTRALRRENQQLRSLLGLTT